MNYNLNSLSKSADEKRSVLSSLKKLVEIISGERKNLILAFLAIFINSGLNLSGTYVLGHSIDAYVQNKDYGGILMFAGILFVMYVSAFAVNYAQMRMMGGIGQRMLFRLRSSVFNKLQEMPVDFFNQNKAGDLISRINNDTEKVNQFFSQSLMRFIGSVINMTGAGILLVSINVKLGLAALSPAIVLLIITRIISPWIRKKNEASLKSLGDLSAEIQESLANFKVVVAFNRRDYFRKRFRLVNDKNYSNSVKAGIANNILTPIYTFASHVGQLIVLALGIVLIINGHFTVGLLISFLAYINNFYHPLRQLAALWSSFQMALAAWDRISKLQSLESNLVTAECSKEKNIHSFIRFENVSFSYPNGKKVLHNANFELQKGKTYAFIGPTGGGKTTTASLIARLYDATEGSVLLFGKDIRWYSPDERAHKIGFILQDPILFTGTVRDNILYGHPQAENLSGEDLLELLKESNLEELLQRFDNGLDTSISMSGEDISLGQKQLIAFIRAILRKPELLILDEATANIDTVTEQQLEAILEKLPSNTTKVIIAHRLNTIEHADEIFFVNSGEIIPAGSFNEAMDMLMHGKMES